MQSRKTFLSILSLFLLITCFNQQMHAETLLCGQDGHGKFRLSPKFKALDFVQERTLLSDWTTSVNTYNSFKSLNCERCLSVSGEFYAGANVVVNVVTKAQGNKTIADITTATTEGGGEKKDSDVTCLVEYNR